MTKKQVWLESTLTLSGGSWGRTGVGHYTEECIAHLAARDTSRDYTVVGNVFMTAKPHAPYDSKLGLRVRLSRLFPGKVWNQLFKRRLMPPLNWLIPGRPDLVVFFNFVRYPLTPGIKSVIVIHDLTFRRFPKAVQTRNRWFLEVFVPRALKRGTHFISVSEATKRDLVELYQVEPEKISIVSPGVDLERYRPGLDTAHVTQKYQLPEHYFIFVSTIEPRKNLPGLLKSYRALPDDIKRRYGLVITGKVGWSAKEIVDDIAAGDPVGRIIHTNYVADADMPALYAGGTAFVLPSYYEGWGLPALEAMASGVPVITSDNSSLPEIVREAGIMLDAEDVAGYTAWMERFANEPKLRAEYAAKGRAQAEHFSWDASGGALLKVIDKVLAD